MLLRVQHTRAGHHVLWLTCQKAVQVETLRVLPLRYVTAGL